MAIPGLTFASCTDPLTRADHHIIAAGEEALELHPLLDRHGKISITQQHIVPAGRQSARAHGKALATMLAAQDLNTRVDRGHGGGTVIASIVNHDHFAAEGLGRQIGAHLLERGGEAPLLVVGRNDN